MSKLKSKSKNPHTLQFFELLAIIYVSGAAFQGSRTAGGGSLLWPRNQRRREKPLLFTLLSNPRGGFTAVYGPAFMMKV